MLGLPRGLEGARLLASCSWEEAMGKVLLPFPHCGAGPPEAGDSCEDRWKEGRGIGEEVGGMGLCFSKEVGGPGERDGSYVTPDIVSPQYYYSGILRLSSFRAGGTPTGVQFLLESPRMSSIALDSPRASLASGEFRLAGGSPRVSADVGDTGTLNALLNRSRQSRGMQLQGPGQGQVQGQGRSGKSLEQGAGAGSGRTVYSAELSSSQRLAATKILECRDSHSKQHCICCTDCGSRKLAKCRDCGSHKLSLCPMCDNRIPRCGECRFGKPLSCGACGSTRLASSLQIEAGKVNCGVCGAAMLASCDRCSTRFKRTTCGQCGRASTDVESREELEEFSEFGLDQSGGEMDSSVEFLELTAGVFEMRRKPPYPPSRSRLQQPRQQLQRQQHQLAGSVNLPAIDMSEEPAALPVSHPEIVPSPTPTPTPDAAAAGTVSSDENPSSTFASPSARSGIQEEVDMELATPDANHSRGLGGGDSELDGREGQDSMSSTEGQIMENGHAEHFHEEASSSHMEEYTPKADSSLEVDDAPAASSSDQGHHMRNISFGMVVPDVPTSSTALPTESGSSSGSGGGSTNRQQLLSQVLYGDVSFSSFLTGPGMAEMATLSDSLDELTLQEFSQQFENVAKTYAEAAAMAAARDAFGFREENDASLTFPRLFDTQAQGGGSTPEVGQWQVPFLSLESDSVPGSADQATGKTANGTGNLVTDVSQQQSVMFSGRAPSSASASTSGTATHVPAGAAGSVDEIEADDDQEQRRSKIMDRMEERFIKAQLHTHGFLLDSLTKEEFADQLRLRHAALRSKLANGSAGAGGAMTGAGEKITRNLQRKSAEFSRTSIKEVAGSEIESETEVVADRKWKGKGKEFEDLLFPSKHKQQGHGAVVEDLLFPSKDKQQGHGPGGKGKQKVVMPDSIPASLQEKVWATERAFYKRKEEIQSIWEEAERERDEEQFNRAAFIESWKASSSKMPSSYPQPISLSSSAVRYGNGSESEPHRLSALKDGPRKAGPGGPGKPPMRVSWGYVVREPRSRSFEEARPRYLAFGDDGGPRRRYSLESQANVMVRDSDLKSCLKKASASPPAVQTGSKESWYPAPGRPGRVPLTFPGGVPAPAPPPSKGESDHLPASREIPIPPKNRRNSGESFKYESLAAFSMVQDYDSDTSVKGRPVAAPDHHNVNGIHHRLRHAPTVMLDCAGQFGRSACRGMSSVETRDQVFGGASRHGHGHAHSHSHSHSHSRSEGRGTRKAGYGVSGEHRDGGFSRGRESPEHVSVQDLCDVLITEHTAAYYDGIPPEFRRRRSSEDKKRGSVSSTAAFPDRILQDEGYGRNLGSETAPFYDRISPDHQSSRSLSSESEPTTLRRSLSSGRMSAMGVESSSSGLRALGALGVMEEEIEQFLGASPIHSKSSRKAEVQRKVNQITSLAHLKKHQLRSDDSSNSSDNWELRRGKSSVIMDDLRFREEEAAASMVESRKAAALAGATAYNEVGSPSSTMEEEVEKFVIAGMDGMSFKPSNGHGSEEMEEEPPIPQAQLPRNRTSTGTVDGLPDWLGTVGYGSAFGSPLDPVTPFRSDVFGGGDKAGPDQRRTFQGTITYGLPAFYSSEKEKNGASRSFSGRYTVSFIDPRSRAAAAAAQEQHHQHQQQQQQQQQRHQHYRRSAAGKGNDSEDDGDSSSDLFEIESLAGTDSLTGPSPRPQDKHRRQGVDRACEIIDVSMFEEFVEASPMSVTVSLNSMECFNGSDMNLSMNFSEDEMDDILVYPRVSAQGVFSHMDSNSEEEETTTERESERDFYRHSRDRDDAYRWSSSLSGSSDMSHLHLHPGAARHGRPSLQPQTQQDLTQQLLKSAHDRRKDFYGGTLARLGIRDAELQRPPMSVSRDTDVGELQLPANGNGINGINGSGIPNSGALYEARKHLLRGRSRQVHNCRPGPGPGPGAGARSRRHLNARR